MNFIWSKWGLCAVNMLATFTQSKTQSEGINNRCMPPGCCWFIALILPHLSCSHSVCKSIQQHVTTIVCWNACSSILIFIHPWLRYVPIFRYLLYVKTHSSQTDSIHMLIFWVWIVVVQMLKRKNMLKSQLQCSFFTSNEAVYKPNDSMTIHEQNMRILKKSSFHSMQ